MRNYFILLILSFLGQSSELYSVEVNNEKLFTQLDNIIANKKTYHLHREAQIAKFKDKLNATDNVEEKYNICGSLFYEYLHYQADSSLYYINQKQRWLAMLNKPELQAEIYINRAEVYGVMGMYNEALAELAKVRKDNLSKGLLCYYYITYRRNYGWLSDYTAERSARKVYDILTESYRDSICMLNVSSTDCKLHKSESFILSGKIDESINMLKDLLSDSIDMKHRVYVNYTLSDAYAAKNDTAMQMRYLAETAILDIQMAEREYASLQRLASLLFAKGELDRAYRYLTCAMDDAVAANARLRYLEAAQIYPIINKAYKTKEAQERAVSRRLLICVSILAFLLILATFYLYYWMKKLSAMRRNLYKANRQLVEANHSLAQTGKIKEVYIAKYLDRCVSYLEKLEQYRRSLEKLAMASKIDELFKTIRSEQFIRDERKTFYNEFDRSFLDLFPHFVEDFNNLLADDAKIFPKKDEQLSTELRIFALIRLGVTDANKIAHFLGYSLATVYNYRSKIRNKAKGDKDSFEQEVMNL